MVSVTGTVTGTGTGTGTDMKPGTDAFRIPVTDMLSVTIRGTE